MDDNANAVYEVDATTGALKRMIPRGDFNSAPRFGGGPVAGTARTDDFESFAYDQANDRLYLFSGPCCSGSILPTAFRLTRQSGTFQVESHQPLASGANYTASSWNSADGKIYVGVGSQLRTYNYETNTAGSTFQVPGLSAILGMGFSVERRRPLRRHECGGPQAGRLGDEDARSWLVVRSHPVRRHGQPGGGVDRRISSSSVTEPIRVPPARSSTPSSSST